MAEHALGHAYLHIIHPPPKDAWEDFASAALVFLGSNVPIFSSYTAMKMFRVISAPQICIMLITHTASELNIKDL